MCDTVINVVNVELTEQSSVICVRTNSDYIESVLFFSMATQFNRAALASDATGNILH